jgi:hypothetical protein
MSSRRRGGGGQREKVIGWKKLKKLKKGKPCENHMIERTCAILRTSFPFRLRSSSFFFLPLAYARECRQGGPPESHQLSLTHDFFFGWSAFHYSLNSREQAGGGKNKSYTVFFFFFFGLWFIFPPHFFSSSVVDWKWTTF